MKNILVTGASSGIGEAICRYLSECDYNVIMVARNADRMNSISRELKCSPLVISYDLRKLDNIIEIFDSIHEQGIKLDGMVHAAGINKDVPIRVNDIESMMEVTTVNYYAFVELGKYFHKKKYSNDGASIVAISSIASSHSDKGMCTYSASKAALDAAASVMAKEFAGRKQRVNTIMPHLVRTPMVTENDSTLSSFEERGAQQLLGLIEPKSIAYLVEFLLSDKASFISDAHIPVGGR